MDFDARDIDTRERDESPIQELRWGDEPPRRLLRQRGDGELLLDREE